MNEQSTNKYLQDFLYEHYIHTEQYLELLSSHGWDTKLELRFRRVIEEWSPNYASIISTMVQAVNDKLREIDNDNEKQKIERLMSTLFKDMIAYFLKTKIDFSKALPNIKESLIELYELNGDNFQALDEMIGLTRIISNTRKSIHLNGRTRRLKWNSTEESFLELEVLFKRKGIMSTSSSLSELTQRDSKGEIIIFNKKKKVFTLVIHRLLYEGLIKPEGGKGTYNFIEKKVRIHETKKKMTEGYMKRTVYNTHKIGIGEQKNGRIIDEFFDCLKK